MSPMQNSAHALGIPITDTLKRVQMQVTPLAMSQYSPDPLAHLPLLPPRSALLMSPDHTQPVP